MPEKSQYTNTDDWYHYDSLIVLVKLTDISGNMHNPEKNMTGYFDTYPSGKHSPQRTLC